MLPNLLVIGAQKSGTTSLHHLLASHTEVFFPARPQEIHFFDLEENFSRGPAWYEAHFEGWSGERYCGQTSPLYLYLPEVPGRIAALLPEVKLVAMLRQPIERAYSQYWHEVRFGFEPLSFEAALAAEPARIAQGPVARRHFSYLDRGRYAGQLARFFEVFGRQRVLVLLQEELRASPVAVQRTLADFLGLSPDGFAARPHERWHLNEAALPRWRRLQRLRPALAGAWPPLAVALDRLNLARASYPRLPAALAARLTADFEAEILALEALSGLDLAAWRRGSEAGCG